MINVEWEGKYSFNKDQVKYIFPEITEGIYRLSNTDGVFYVGQSDNLQRILLEHLSEEKNDCIKKRLKTNISFRFARLKYKKERLCAVSYMYQQYKKKDMVECNDKEPSETQCEINLLQNISIHIRIQMNTQIKDVITQFYVTLMTE